MVIMTFSKTNIELFAQEFTVYWKKSSKIKTKFSCLIFYSHNQSFERYAFKYIETYIDGFAKWVEVLVQTETMNFGRTIS